jgi:hypothetical protein
MKNRPESRKAQHSNRTRKIAWSPTLNLPKDNQATCLIVRRLRVFTVHSTDDSEGKITVVGTNWLATVLITSSYSVAPVRS